MPSTSTGDGHRFGYNEASKNVPHLYRCRVPNWCSGGEHISRLVETPLMKLIFSTNEKINFELGRYKTELIRKTVVLTTVFFYKFHKKFH